MEILSNTFNKDILKEKWKLKSVYGEDTPVKPKYCIFNNTYEAISLLHKHIRANSKIVFHTDVDVDGVGTTYILKTTLNNLGSNNHILLINRDKTHGIQQKHVDYFADKDIGLMLITDSSCNAIDIIKQFNCDVLCVDHHDMQHNDTLGTCNNGKNKYVIVNNNIDSTTYEQDYNWIKSVNSQAFSEEDLEYYKAEHDMSCGLVIYELLRLYCALINKSKLLENLKLHQWAATTLFTDAIDTLNNRNQWYIENTVFSREIESCMAVMMKSVNNFKATLDKSYIEYSLAPIINKAIRAGKSNEVLDKVINNPANIGDLKVYNKLQVDAIEKATTIDIDGEKRPILFNSNTIKLNMTRLGVHPNYSGVVASKLSGNNNKSAAVFIELPNGKYKGSFRGICKDIDYRKYFEDYSPDIFAQGHPPAFGFELYPVQLDELMDGLSKLEPKGEEKTWISMGHVDDEHKGVYHVDDIESFRRQGYIWKIAMGNAKVTSKDEITIRVSARDTVLKETKGKVFIYNILGFECKAFKPLEGDFFELYIEYSKEINMFIR